MLTVKTQVFLDYGEGFEIRAVQNQSCLNDEEEGEESEEGEVGFAWRGCHFRQSSMFCVTGRFELVSLGRVSGYYSFAVFDFYKRPPCRKIWMWSPCRWTLVSIFHVLTRI